MLTIALPRLAARLRDKDARIVEVAPLAEHAVEKLILNLQNNTA